MTKLAFLVVCLFSLGSFGEDKKNLEYIPGQKGLTWDEYNSLAMQFSATRSRDAAGDVAEKNQAYNLKIELEALHSLQRVLADPQPRIFYAGFEDEKSVIDADGEINTKDGLCGFKVVRQIEIKDSKNKPRLISSIFSYTFNPTTKRFQLRTGADIVRVRFELEPFHLVTSARTKKEIGRGIAAFSWFADGTQIRAVPYTKSYPGPLSEGEPNYEQKRRGFAFRPYTPCSLPDHCMACHHAKNRTVFEPSVFTEFAAAPEESKAAIDFINYAKNQLNLNAEELTETISLLRNPAQAFPTAGLVTAVEARLKELASSGKAPNYSK